MLVSCGSGESSSQAVSAAESAVVTTVTTALTDLPATASETADKLDREITQTTNPVLFKSASSLNNPLVTNMFCADPTAVEYNGRLYVYGTNDEQQYLEKGDKENTYEKIRTLVILSTDDLVNWRFEGKINTKQIAPWINASWAPSVVSRVEEDGLTHFYLYFSNSGNGVGVLTSTDPVGPWTDPLRKPLIRAGMQGLKNCPIPFDPGACIDGDGVGWLAFGGGEGKSKYMPGVSRIVKLGADMISFDSDFTEVNCPYFFEASELNYIGGQYLYTFNTSWENRTEWDKSTGTTAPPTCSMAYMKTTTPLDTDSWQYQDFYLKNPGQLGMEYGNNHTHLQKFGDQYYILFHAQILYKQRGLKHAFRSICIDRIDVNEENAVISKCTATKRGAPQLHSLDPYITHQAEECYLTDCEYRDEVGAIFAKCSAEKIIGVKNVSFGDSCKSFAARVRGKGVIEVRTDDANGEKVSAVKFDCSDWTVMTAPCTAKGDTDLYFVFDGSFDFDSWEFSE